MIALKSLLRAAVSSCAILLLLGSLFPVQADPKPDLITGFPRETCQLKEWKPGKKVAVCFVLHVEVWGVGMGPNFRDDLASRKPDLVNEAFRRYGINYGIERAGRVFLEEDAPLTISLNALFPVQEPDVWSKFRGLFPNSPIIAHGMNNSTDQLPIGQGWVKQEAYIKKTLDLIESKTGVRPKGWSSPSIYSDVETYRAIAASGVAYTTDAMDSDNLSVLTTPAGKLDMVPYPPVTVDMGQYLGRNCQPEELERLWVNYVNELAREADKNPDGKATVIAIGLHPFIVGTPNGAAALRGTLEALKKNPAVWLTDVEAVVKASNIQSK